MAADDDLDAVADRLYALPPEDFTAARDDAAKQADTKPLRAAVKALRRPTASAWLVNLLAQQQPELLEQVLALGPALAQAQAEGSGDALRQLGQQRRELVAAVTGTAVDLADRDVPSATRAEVEQTLEAALADPATAEAVRSGRLVRALSYAGFGGVDLDGAVATAARRAPRTKPEPKDDGLEQAALDAAAALDDAVRACESAEREGRTAREQAEAAEADAAEAAAEVTRLEAELAEARRRSTAATRVASSAAQRTRASDDASHRARDGVAAAQQQAESARSALDRARRG